MDQPVDDCIGDDGIAEYLSPLRQWLIGGHDDGPLLVSCCDELEEKPGDIPVDGEIPYLVDDEKLVVVTMTDLFSYLAATSWKKSPAIFLSTGKYPISSMMRSL